jgi:hypothetical protein
VSPLEQKLIDHDPAAHAFNGWVRVDSGTWIVVHSGPTASAVWDFLLPLRLGQHCEKCVLPAGDRPDKKRRR